MAELLPDAAPDILTFTAFPVAHWQKLWSNLDFTHFNPNPPRHGLRESLEGGVRKLQTRWPGLEFA